MDIASTLKGFIGLYRALENDDKALATKTEDFAALCCVYTMLKCIDLYIEFNTVVEFAKISLRCGDPDRETIANKIVELLCQLFDVESMEDLDSDHIAIDCDNDGTYTITTYSTEGVSLIEEATKKLEAKFGL